jgi:hypothetical protein
MRYEERVPDQLFQADGHYLGRPADFTDRIVDLSSLLHFWRRINDTRKSNPTVTE